MGQVIAGLNSHHGAHQKVPSPIQVTARFGLQHNLSQAPPSPSQLTANHRSPCNSYQEAPNLTQAVADLGLQQNPSEKTPEPTYLVTILKVARMKHQVTYKRNLIKLSADFLEVTLQFRKEWQEIFKVLKKSNLHPSILHPVRFIIHNWR